MRLFDFIAGLFVALVSLTMIVMALGEALTGGLRLSSSGGPVDPTPAAIFFIWLCATAYLAARIIYLSAMAPPAPESEGEKR